MQFLNHLEIPPFQEIAEIGRLKGSESTLKHFLIILKLTSSTPELLLIFSKINASFNLFIYKGLDSIMTFTLLIYISNVLDDFGIWLDSDQYLQKNL